MTDGRADQRRVGAADPGPTALGYLRFRAGGRQLIGSERRRYGLAWIGHFFIERNGPATFTSPSKAFVCDLRMLGLALRGELHEEFERHGIAGRAEPNARRAARSHGLPLPGSR